MDRNEILSSRILEFVQGVVEENNLLQHGESLMVEFSIKQAPSSGSQQVIVISEDVLYKSIDDLDLKVRSYNVLKNASAGRIREIIQMTELELLKRKDSGRVTVSDVRRALAQYGLTLLGSKLWTGETLEDLAISDSVVKKLRSQGITCVNEILEYSKDYFCKLPKPGTTSTMFTKDDVNQIENRLRDIWPSIPEGKDKVVAFLTSHQ